ncbi:MAG: SDR family NAD(P)-dependent oxidoreductase [Selenomonadaceae bacterium]|nr:SDR family NAD(P)-dependent oxidoreductase [Selenomonadaceae bacterium]MDD7057234.1 SDR family NAD(P)-dependent oxidoreductase [Selenomonadaceae bacterium]
MNIAIITGASSGLGRAYARLLDAEYLDEIWLIARREERLQELAQELRTSCRIFACDLTQPGVPAILQASLGERPDTEVRWLINAAGFGRLGYTTEIPLAEQLAMIDLNVKATVALTQLAIPFMSAGSHIMEIVSCSAFQPIPGLNVYAATKAFLLRYSRALGAELAPQGIIVTAVCPYWIRDTEFIPLASATDAHHLFRGFPLATTCEEVARRSLRAAKNNIAVCTPDAISFLHRILSTIIPHKLLMAASTIFHGLHK